LPVVLERIGQEFLSLATKLTLIFNFRAVKLRSVGRRPGPYPRILGEPHRRMIVCHCRGLSEREIRRAVVEGARDADAIARCCLAGAECGGCRPLIEQLLRAHRGLEDRQSATARD